MQLHASPYNFDRGEATTSQSFQTRVGRYLLKTHVPLGKTTCFDIKISLSPHTSIQWRPLASCGPLRPPFKPSLARRERIFFHALISRGIRNVSCELTQWEAKWSINLPLSRCLRTSWNSNPSVKRWDYSNICIAYVNFLQLGNSRNLKTPPSPSFLMHPRPRYSFIRLPMVCWSYAVEHTSGICVIVCDWLITFPLKN